MFLFGCEKKSLINNVLGITDPAESVKRVNCQKKIETLLAGVKDTTRKRFCNELVDLCFEERGKAHKLALYIKDVDNIASSITNKDLLSRFD